MALPEEDGVPLQRLLLEEVRNNTSEKLDDRERVELFHSVFILE
jgi:hypothetical protein